MSRKVQTLIRISFSCIKVPFIVPNRLKEENKVWIPDVLFFILQQHLKTIVVTHFLLNIGLSLSLLICLLA